MSIENSKSSETVASAVARKTGFVEGMSAGGVFTTTCYDVNGNEKWVEIAPNLVVNVGLQSMNTQFFTGSAYTAAWYIGLVNGTSATTTFSGGDTLATHAGWTENSGYAGDRKVCTFGVATLADPSNINNSSSTASFTVTANSTIAGAFLANVATGTSGLLFSESDFQSPGDRTVVVGDVLVVTYSFNLDAT
jgi:hypothetical protein